MRATLAVATLIVLASDHGDYLGDFGLVGKTTLYEPSANVELQLTRFHGRHESSAGGAPG